MSYKIIMSTDQMIFWRHSLSLKNSDLRYRGARGSLSPFTRRIVERKTYQSKPSSESLGSRYHDNQYASMASRR